MANFAVSDADRLRIAIAWTVLKFKPADQSCASYAVQLRSRFSSSTAASRTVDGSWKGRALALEKDLAALKEKYEAEQLKTLVFPPPPVPDATPSGSQPPKRKPKKKSMLDKRPDPPPRVDLDSIIEALGRTEFVSLPTSDSLGSSFSAFQQLTSALDSSELAVTAAHRSLLLSTAIRALAALANVFHPILRSTEITVASQSSTLQTLTLLANHLVSSSVPFLLRRPKKNTTQPASVSSLLNKLLDALITQIFRPIIDSFYPLSHRYLTGLFSPTPLPKLPVDLRPDVLHLFQSALSPLLSAPSGCDVNLRSTLAVAALRELENLFPPRRTDSSRLPRTHDSRVSALVRKDALWYLCTTLHTLFAPRKDCSTSGSAARAQPDGAVSERRILDALSRIVNRCRSFTDSTETRICSGELPGRNSDIEDEGLRFIGPANDLDLEVIDELGYGMILGVMERYWQWIEDIQPENAVVDFFPQP